MSPAARPIGGWFPCVRCGTRMRRQKVPGRVELRCPRCRYLIFDYPRPCSGVIVIRDACVLALRRAHPPRIGALDIPGGFMEAGESIVAAARRELLEETGLRVGVLAPLGLYWDRYQLEGFGRFPTMNFYYVARWRSGTPVAADDAASAEWIALDSIQRHARDFAWPHMKTVFRDAAKKLGRGAKKRGRRKVLPAPGRRSGRISSAAR